MNEYDCVNKSSLKFKGEKKKKKSKKSKDKCQQRADDKSGEGPSHRDERSEDADEHGGWWKVDRYEHIQDEVAIEFIPGCYAKALSNGNIILGNVHPPGEGPDEEEIFTAVCAATNQIAFKSGFGRYLSIDTRKRLVGLSEAIGEQETFLPVFEDGKLALSAYNDCFLSPDEESETQYVMAQVPKAGPYEMLNIRINHDPCLFTKNHQKDKDLLPEDMGTLYETELGYLKKYQSHGQKHFSLSEDKERLKKARIEGQLHEALLDKRMKLKSDKYCK